MLATKEDLDAITDDDPLCYALVNTDALVLHTDATTSMPPAVINLCMSMKMFFQLRSLQDCHPLEGFNTRLT